MLTQALLALALAAARPFGPDDLVALPRVSAPAISPDGTRAAYTIGRPAPGGDKLRSALWLATALDRSTWNKAGLPAPRQLTSGEERVSAPRFAPDGRHLAFVSDRATPPQVFMLDLVAGGEALKVTSLPGGVSDFLFTPDGKALLVTSDIHPECGGDADCHARVEEELRGRPHVATRLLFRHWKEWRERIRSHLFRVPLDGGPALDLTPGERDVPPVQRGTVDDLAVSPDGKTVYFVAVTDPVEAISTNADVYAVPAGGGEARRITSGPGWDGIPRPSPDGRQLAWLSMARAGYEADRLRIMVAAADGSGAREVAPELDLPASDLTWAKGGRALRFLALERGVHRLFEVDVRSGRVTALAHGAGAPGTARNVESICWSADGERAVALLDGLLDPPELARLGADAKGNLQWSRVTAHAADALADVPRPTVHELAAKAKDGTALHGFLLLPPGAKAGERLPGLLLVHGGPQGAWTDGWTFRWNAMLYAAQGYAVVLPNPRGSTGYGQAFTDAVSRDWGGAPYEDVLALLDAAVEAGAVDGERTCAAGASYGGYMVNWLNATTTRFRCLVAHASIFDLRMAYYTTEELWFPEWEQGGTPFGAPEAYERFSPSRLAGRMRTPTLVTHGEQDYRCTVDQAYATFTALQRQGVPSKLVIFPDEGHWILRPKNSKAFYDVVLAWLGDHLGPRRTATTSAP